ncbi:MAG: PaaI family thioesterase [Tepidisphaeraceae bacterium]|jgi:acyl-coenzyme A thioesterase PaaI-like protein
MPLELPHTSGCLVCGPVNARGFGLKLYVDPASGLVETRYVPVIQHVGFEGIVHGGAIASVMDEAMVWTASWHGKRFCVCGEMTVRFRQSAKIGRALTCRARVDSGRARLVLTSCEAIDESGAIVASGNGKYVPLSPAENRAFLDTFIRSPETEAAAQIFRAGA